MSQSVAAGTISSVQSFIGEHLDAPADGRKSKLTAIGGVVFAIALVVYVLAEAARFDVATLRASLPTNPLFWLLAPTPLLVGPVTEWIILRKLWKLPLTGLVPLAHKQASNEIIMGYAGDVQFYLWARKNAQLTGSPFKTLRDMSVLSALAGNISTLFLMIVTYPLLRALVSGPMMNVAIVSVAIVVCTSIAIFVAQRTLFMFSISRSMIFTVLGLNFARITLSLAFNAMLWAIMIPSISLGTIMTLATVRMMLSRVPFLPGKEVVFGGIALYLMADASMIARAVAVTAAIAFLLNAAIASGSGLLDLGRAVRRWRGLEA